MPGRERDLAPLAFPSLTGHFRRSEEPVFQAVCSVLCLQLWTPGRPPTSLGHTGTVKPSRDWHIFGTLFFLLLSRCFPPSLPPLPTSCVVPVKNRLRAICVCMGRSKDVVVGQWWSANMIDPSQSDFYFFYVRGRCCLCCVGTHIGLSI